MDNSTYKARKEREVLSRKWCWQTKAMSNTKTSLLISFPLLPFLPLLTIVMPSADGKSVSPFLLRYLHWCFPQITVLGPWTSVRLPRSVSHWSWNSLPTDALSCIFPLYGHFIVFLALGIRYYSELNYNIKPLSFCFSYCVGTQYMSSVLLLLRKMILKLGCILKLPGELLKTIQMPRPHSR